MIIHVVTRRWLSRVRLVLFKILLGAVLPHPQQVRADEVIQLDIARTNAQVLLTWTNAGVALESALVITGSWNELTGAISPLLVSPSNFATFFRLRQTVSPPVIAARYGAPTFTTAIGDPFGCGCTSPENPNSLATGGSAQDNAGGAALLHTGELTQSAVDLEIPGRGFDWRFERRYRSGMTYDGPLGQGWDFNYNRRLVAETNGNVLCVNGLGRVDRYTLNTNGTFTAPAGIYARLARHPDGTFTERDRHGSTNSYAATNALGIARLTRISDRNGNQMTFQYTTAGQLTNVTDTLARNMAYRYDANGRLTNVTDFAGRTLRFAYDGNGNLVSATSPSVTGTPTGNDFPSGKTTVYSYASGFGDARFNHNLLSVTAPNEVAVAGSARLVAQYETNPVSPHADRLVSLRLGGTNVSGVGAGGTLTYTYASFGPAGSNDFATVVFQNTVTNRNGNRTEYRFNQLGNIVRAIQFTRGVRAGDPPGFTNTFAYNADGELIGRTNAELDSAEHTFDPANPDRLQQGNLRQVRRLPGPRGGDQAQIVVSNSYEASFNFVASSTDARGNTTTYSYDARGNRIHTTHRIPAIVEDFEYNAFGQMTAHVLPDNGSGHRRRDEQTYYMAGPQSGYLQHQIVDAGSAKFNLTTTYEYDPVGNRVRLVDPRGNDTLYSVNALNQVVRQSSREVATLTGPVRYERDTFYDANDNVVRVDVQNRDDTGAVVGANPVFTTTYAYDILDGPLSTTQEVDAAANVVTAYAYDANQNRRLMRQGEAVNGHDPFNVVQDLHDERDLLFRQIRAPGSPAQSTAQFDYDANGNLRRNSHGLESVPHNTLHTYDGFDRRVSTTDAMGNVSSARFDANGNVVSNRVDGQLVDVPGGVGNANLSATAFAYDAMDRLIRQDQTFFDTQTQVPIGDGQSTTRTFYSDNSQVLRLVDDNNHTNTTAYDTANRRRTVTDPKTNTITYTYDANGNLVTNTEVDRSDLGNPNQTFVTTYTYDALDRPVLTVDNVNNTNRSAYDSRNNRVLQLDARNNATRHEFDGLNRLLRTLRDMDANASFTDPDDIVTSLTWDDSSRLTGQTDDNTNTTAYFYDALDRRVRTEYADCTSDQRTYDVHDNATQTTDANGSTVMNAYDDNDRVINKLIVIGPGVSPATTFETFQYDGRSRLVRAEDDDSIVTRAYDSLSGVTSESQQIAGGPAQTITGNYDGERNQTRLLYPGGRAIVRTYDLLDRPFVIRDDPPGPGATIATYRYIGPYRVERRDYGGPPVTRYTPTYDGIRRIIYTRHTLVSSGVPFEERAYAWDPVHNKLVMDNLLAAPSPDLHNYAYDAANRLIFSHHLTPLTNPPTTYVLDGVGNRVSVGGPVNPGPYTMDPTLCDPADFQMNQYTTTPFNTSRLHDDNGNLTDVNSGALLNTYDYRNRLVEFFSAGAGQTNNYRYDCFGRRIEKSVAGAVTRFYYDGTELIEEQDAADATLATYVYSKGFASRLQMVRGGQKYFYHTDDLGSVRAVTSANGVVVERYDYADYGAANITPGGTIVQAPGAGLGYRSDLDPVPGPQVIADDFQVAQLETITSLRWWGFYIGGQVADDFSIVIFDDAGGLPGSPIYQANPGAAVTRTAAPGGFQYDVDLSPAFEAQPGVRYWVEIVNNLPGPPYWAWRVAAPANTAAAFAANQFGPWNPVTDDLAFALNPLASPGNPFLFHGQYFDAESSRYWTGDRYLATGSGRYIERGDQGSVYVPDVWKTDPVPWVRDTDMDRIDDLIDVGVETRYDIIIDFGNPYTFAANNPTSAAICPYCGGCSGCGHKPDCPLNDPPPPHPPPPVTDELPPIEIVSMSLTGDFDPTRGMQQDRRPMDPDFWEDMKRHGSGGRQEKPPRPAWAASEDPDLQVSSDRLRQRISELMEEIRDLLRNAPPGRFRDGAIDRRQKEILKLDKELRRRGE